MDCKSTLQHQQFQNLCLSGELKERTWSLIGQQIAVNDTDNSNKSICEPSEKHIKPTDSDSDSQEVESTSNGVQRYKKERRVAESVDPKQWKLNKHRYSKLALSAKTVVHTSHLSSM